jgi:parvulin-like peptidyl-prolyl isomerase
MTRAKPKSQSRQSTRSQRPTASRESGSELGEGTRLFLLVGVGVLVVAVLGVIGYLVVSSLFPSNPVVMRVGDDEVRLNYYSARLETFTNEQGAGLTDPNQLFPLGHVLIEEIAEERVLLQSLDDRGISVSDEEVQQQIELTVGASPESAFQLYRSGLTEELDNLNLSEGEYREMVRAQLARTKLQEQFQAEVGETAPQARFHRLDPTSREDAEEAQRRLEEGEDFAQIALDLSPQSIEPESGPDWVTVGTLDRPIRDAIDGLEADAVSDPIQTDIGFTVVQLLEKQARPLEESDKSALATALFNQYIEDRKEELGFVDDLSDDELTDAFQSFL